MNPQDKEIDGLKEEVNTLCAELKEKDDKINELEEQVYDLEDILKQIKHLVV